MKITSKKILQNWLYILLMILIGFILIGFYIISSGRQFTNDSTDDFYNFNLNEKKQALKQEVENRLDEIEYERSMMLTQEKALITTKIHDLADYLSDTIAIPTDSQVYDYSDFIHQLNEFVSYDNYLYFAIKPNGDLIRSGTDNEVTGVNLYDSVDIEGNYFIQDIIQAKNNPDGIFVDYYWPKVKDGPPFKKTSYCLYLEPFDIIIGVGSYYDEMEANLRQQLYQKIQSYYKEKENYIFINDYDSTARVSVKDEFVGTKMSDLLSLNGDSIHQLIMDVITNESSGFINYQFIRRSDETTTDILSEKISYVHILEDWNAYIGMGFYIDDLNNEIQENTHKFTSHYYNQMFFIITSLILISIVVYALLQKGAYMQHQLLQQSDIVYEKLFLLSTDAIMVVSSQQTILYMNKFAKKIFSNELEGHIIEDHLPFIKIDNDVYSFESSSNRVYYLTISSENVSFHNKDSNIYFIRDITKQYLETHELIQIAYLDPLTALPNRRALLNDFEDHCYHKKNESIIICMLDIDHFKKVNDNYGHDVGDKVLKIIADVFTHRLRHFDKIYRYGGEEFALVLIDTDISNGKKLVNEINHVFCETVQSTLGFPCTFSCGMIEVTIDDSNTDISTYLTQADRLLYKAKSNGRNRIESD